MQHIILGVVLGFVADQAHAQDPDECAMDTSPLIWNLYQIQAFDTGYDGTGVTVAVLQGGWPRNWEEYLPPGSMDLTYAVGFGPNGIGDTNSFSAASATKQSDVWYGPSDPSHAIMVASAIVGYRVPAETLEQFGVGPCTAGVAVGARILPIRVTQAGTAAAVQYVADLTREGAFPGGIVIVYTGAFEMPEEGNPLFH